MDIFTRSLEIFCKSASYKSILLRSRRFLELQRIGMALTLARHFCRWQENGQRNYPVILAFCKTKCQNFHFKLFRMHILDLDFGLHLVYQMT